MKVININVNNKIAISPDAVIVCGNSDYIIEFTFDEEWLQQNAKTARFIYNGIAEDKPFTGNRVKVPVMKNTTLLSVGVYAGDLQTTTPALIACKKSILCEDGLPPDPAPEVYAQIMKMINEIPTGGGGGTDADGKDGFSPIVEITDTETGHTVTITDINGVHSFEVADGKNGIDGATGAAGADGKTPKKGVDYFTEADKAEMVTAVINSLPTWNGGAY